MRNLLTRMRAALAVSLIAAFAAAPAPAATRTAPTVSLDVHSMLLTDALRMIAMQTKRNIVADDSLEQMHVTMHLEGISADRALHVLTQAYGLVAVEDNGITMITTAKSISQRRDATDKNSLETSIVRMNNASPTQVADVLRPLLDSSLYSIDALHNSVVFVGNSTKVRRAKSILHSIDHVAPQISLEIKVIDVATDDRSTIGTLFGDADVNVGQTATAFKTSAIPLGMRINELIVNGKAKILATPRITCLNNVQCKFLVGQEFPLVTTTVQNGFAIQSVSYKGIGVDLVVLPTIGADGTIMAHLTPSYTGTQSTSSGGYPILSSRSVDAVLRVANNETIVLAGLLQDIDNDTVTKVPLLGDLPIFGGIFRNRDHYHHRDEIVFLITPHILS